MALLVVCDFFLIGGVRGWDWRRSWGGEEVPQMVGAHWLRLCFRVVFLQPDADVVRLVNDDCWSEKWALSSGSLGRAFCVSSFSVFSPRLPLCPPNGHERTTQRMSRTTGWQSMARRSSTP
ncbi:unnamed protein product, partial [Phaeothamnion confervicola]